MQSPFFDPSKTYDENDSAGPFNGFADGVDLRDSTSEPKFNFLGYKIHTPFGIPSGPLLNSKYCKGAFEKGFDVIHYKTRRSGTFPCNPFPNVVFLRIDEDLTLQRAKKTIIGDTNPPSDPTKFSITNSFGNPSPDPTVWQEDMKKALSFEGRGQLLIGSAVGTIREGFSEEDYWNDFALTAKLAAETGVKVIEVNLSCPNVASEGILCFSKEAVVAVCRKSKEAIGDKPLLVKFGYFSKDQQELLETIMKDISPFIAGVCAINTIPAPVIDEDGNQILPGPGRLMAGICGASIKWAGLDMVKRLNQIKEKLNLNFAIIGVGGVMNPEDYFEYKKLGADVVQSATGAMWNTNLAKQIKEKEKAKAEILAGLDPVQLVG